MSLHGWPRSLGRWPCVSKKAVCLNKKPPSGGFLLGSDLIQARLSGEASCDQRMVSPRCVAIWFRAQLVAADTPSDQFDVGVAV